MQLNSASGTSKTSLNTTGASSAVDAKTSWAMGAIMTSQIARYLGASSNQLPGNVRITPNGKMVSVIDIIMVVSFTDDAGRLKRSAQKNASEYNKILLRDHPEVSSLQRNFRFSGQGQRDTPVAGRKGILQII